MSRQICTCVGTCKGSRGLATGWWCAVEFFKLHPRACGHQGSFRIQWFDGTIQCWCGDIIYHIPRAERSANAEIELLRNLLDEVRELIATAILGWPEDAQVIGDWPLKSLTAWVHKYDAISRS